MQAACAGAEEWTQLFKRYIHDYICKLIMTSDSAGEILDSDLLSLSLISCLRTAAEPSCAHMLSLERLSAATRLVLSMAAAKEELAKLFPAASAEVLARLLELAPKHADDADDLFAKWEAYALKNPRAEYTDAAAIDRFAEHLMQAQRLTPVKRPLFSLKSGSPGNLGTPTRLRRGRMTSAPAPVLARRETVSASVTLAGAPINLEHMRQLATGVQLLSNVAALEKHKPYYDKPVAIAAALEARVEQLATAFAEHARLNVAALANPRLITQAPVWAVGMICRDAPALTDMAEARRVWSRPLAPGSLMLETARGADGGETRVRLDLERVKTEQEAKTLFEGSVVAVRGRNPRGDVFVVEEVAEMPALPPPVMPARAHGALKLAVLSAAACARELADFVHFAARVGASVAVVLGPLPAGFSPELRTALGANTPLVLVPSPADELCDCVFPQLPYQLPADVAAHGSIIDAPNPCTLSVGGFRVVCAANSALADLRAVQLGTRFRAILAQRRLYPLYPPPPDVNVDYSSLGLVDLAVLPHLLVLSGENGAERVDGVVCVSLTGAAVVTIADDSQQVDFVDFVDLADTQTAAAT